MKSSRVLSFCVGTMSLTVGAALGCQASGSYPDWQSEPSPPTPSPPATPPTTSPLPITPAILPQPPPISGGTLLVLQDGTTAVAADPDRDLVWVVDLATPMVLQTVRLQPGDEPGRVVEDAAGRVHVALRRGGALVSIDPTTGAILERRPVCAAPRGVAYDPAIDAIHVACADGVLATFPAAGGAAVRVVQPDDDLRDVVIHNGVLYVSRFRAAELLQIAADGSVAQRITMATAAGQMTPVGGPITNTPGVAYRTVALPGGGLAMLHQRAQVEAVATTPGGYAAGGCPGSGIVQDTVSFIAPGTPPVAELPLGMMTLAVDLAVSADGTQVAVAAPGSNFSSGASTYPIDMLQQPSGPPCILPASAGLGQGQQPIAVAFDGQNNLIVQTRDPATIIAGSQTLVLPGESMDNDGHTNFHMGTKGGIACASCHPEGGDDGRVWQFTGLGARRTQNLRGGVLARMPFHWSGDIADMDALVSVVMVGRMAGPQLDAQQTADLGAWMNGLPALTAPPAADPASVARGALLFTDSSVGCGTCHSGPQLSTHQLLDVGTGGTFKVPSLIGVGYRAPYLHTGCAATLLDRFTDPTCGGGAQHGTTAQLDAGQLGDLVAYLQSL